MMRARALLDGALSTLFTASATTLPPSETPSHWYWWGEAWVVITLFCVIHLRTTSSHSLGARIIFQERNYLGFADK